VSPTLAAEQVIVTPLDARRKSATVMATVALNDPFIAVIVDVPLATEVTNPDDDTVATDELDEDHVTVGLEITVPPASLIVGTTVTVSPTDANVFSVGVIVIDVPT
jgi:hypothetical protein